MRAVKREFGKRGKSHDTPAVYVSTTSTMHEAIAVLTGNVVNIKETGVRLPALSDVNLAAATPF
jgi:hypothetical protein